MTETTFIRTFSLSIAGTLALASLGVILLALMRGQDLSEVQHLVSLAGMGVAASALLCILVVRWAIVSIRGEFGSKEKGYMQAVTIGFGILLVAFWALDQARAGMDGCFVGVMALGVAIVVGSFRLSQALVPGHKRFAFNMSVIAVTWGALAAWGIGFQIVWDWSPAYGALAVLAVILVAVLAVFPLSRQEQRGEFAGVPDSYD